jgi:putative ABC transport system permease protein
MLSSYLKTSGRTLVRNKLFSAINIFGLAISMSVGLLMISFVVDLTSYDQFHKKADRIYRVITDYTRTDGKQTHLASTSVRAGDRISETFSGVEHVAMLRSGFGGDAAFGDQVVPFKGLWASENFFDVFTFPLIEGNAATALKEPYSIVLTATAAKKLFGTASPLGKTIHFIDPSRKNQQGSEGNGETKNSAYVITGVIEDIPKFSHMQFEVLVSLAGARVEAINDKDFLSWEEVWQNYVYVVLPEDGSSDNLQVNLNKLAEEENKGLKHTKVELKAQALSDIALGPDLSNNIGPTMISSIVWIIGGLSFVVVLSACFNYTNLSIARSLRRSREVGIRKVIGALKGHVLAQFVVESILIAMFALVFSVVLFFIIKPHFISVAPELSRMVLLDLSLPIVIYFILFAIMVGLLAGILPAIFFSEINAAKVLKNSLGVSGFKRLNLRKALIVGQYTCSLVFITATLIVQKQYKHFLSFDLGFQTENILNINMQSNKAELLQVELQQMPEVQAISKSQMITSVGNYYGTYMKYENPQDSALIWYNSIDEHYLPLHGHKLITGRNFTARTENEKESEVIVNEVALKRFNIADRDPLKALGEVVTINGEKMEIIGVMKDFHYGKVDSKIDPVVFRYLNKNADFLNVKIASNDIVGTMNKIEGMWKKLDSVHSFDAHFYEDQIEDAYSEYSAMITVVGFMAFLTISIASIGLLGMVVFTTETKLKEISIRKVLGASDGNLVFLLGKGFMLLLLISALIALPTTYMFFDGVLLSDVTYRAPIGALEMFLGLSIVLAIALIMITSQTLKVSRTNPAIVLKSE